MKGKKFLLSLILLMAVGILFIQIGPALGTSFPNLLWEYTGVEISLFPPVYYDYPISGVTGSPAIGDDGTIYIGSHNGVFYAIEPYGLTKWAIELGGSFEYSPAIGDNGTIYASNGPVLYAFHPNGMIIWSTNVGCLFLGAPAIGKKGTIYIGSNANILYAFYPNGTKKWEFVGNELGPPNGIFANPVIGADGTIYCGYNYPGSLDGAFYAIRPDGTQKWGLLGLDGGRCADYSAAIGPDGSIYFVRLNSLLFSYSPDGSMNWSYQMTTSLPIQCSPVIGDDGTIYTVDRKWLYAIDPNGIEKWRTEQLDRWIATTPAVGANGVIYLGASLDFVGVIHALHSDGSPYWSYWAEVVQGSSPAIIKAGDLGVLYLGFDSTVKALQVDSPGVALSSWPMHRANLKRNGRVNFYAPQIKLITNLIDIIIENNFKKGTEYSLKSKLESAIQSLEKENANAAKNKLNAFINQVMALKGKKISAEIAGTLISHAQRIIVSL